MRFTITIALDRTGWEPVQGSTVEPRWQNIMGDEMVFSVVRGRAELGDFRDITAVRRSLRERLGKEGATISCDAAAISSLPAIQSVWKAPAGRGFAMTYFASVNVQADDWMIEIKITSTETGITGVREAVLTAELIQSATPLEMQQIQNNDLPPAWRFERYEPDVSGPFAYLITDDETYDVRFPEHPLSRLRRSLRRIVRTLDVRISGGDVRSGWRKVLGLFSSGSARQVAIRLEQPAVEALGPERFVEEFGSQALQDAVMAEVFRKAGLPQPSLATRQQACLERMQAELKAFFEQQQVRDTQAKAVKEEVDRLEKELSASQMEVYVVRVRASDSRPTMNEGDLEGVLLAFTAKAFVDDFLATKAVETDVARITLSELFAQRSALESEGVKAITWNRCPHCAEPRPVLQLSAMSSEKDLLRLHLACELTHKSMVERNLAAAAKIEDAVERMSLLQYTRQHVDPGGVEINLEIGWLAQATGDMAALAESRRRLDLYAPQHLPRLSDEPL